MAQEYKLTHVQIDKNPFVDNHGNEWLTVAFEGVSEPVKWVVKDKNKVVVGSTYYGDIREATTKNGKAYQRFHRESRPDNQTQSQGGYSGAPKREYRDNSDGQRQGMCINNAAYYIATKHKDADNVILNSDEWAHMVHEYANELYKMGDLGETSDAEMESLMNSLPGKDEAMGMSFQDWRNDNDHE